MAAQDLNAGLGTPTAHFEGNGPAMAGFVILLATLVLGGLILSSGLSTLSKRPNDPDATLISAVGILIIVIAFIVFYLLSKRRSGLYVQTYSDGLVRTKGSKVQEVHWDDVRATWQSIAKHYYNGAYTGTTYLYTVQTNDNSKFVFGNEIKGIEELGQLIQNESTKRLFPKMIAAYNAGQAVPFGDFSISKDGVNHKNKSLPWAEIEGAQINNGFVTFKKQGKWFNWARVSASKIPNLPSFLALIDHVVGVKARR